MPTEALLKLAKALQTSTDPEASPSTPLAYMGELPDQMPMFAWAGVGLSKEETCRIYLAMQKLAKEKELPMVRFFGKIFGTKADYVVRGGRARTLTSCRLPPRRARRQRRSRAWVSTGGRTSFRARHVRVCSWRM